MYLPTRSARRSQRTWSGDIALRGLGILLLRASYGVALYLHRHMAEPLQTRATPADFAIATVVFATLVSGLAFAVEGAGLFRLVPMPPRSFLN